MADQRGASTASIGRRLRDLHGARGLSLRELARVTFRVGHDEHHPGPGDALSFANFEPHQVRNEGSVRARAIVCVVGDEDGHRPPET
jgi:hypothetical protein